MAKKTIADIDVSGKTVLMRVDFNVPVKDGKVANDKRIVAALPTIRRVLKAGARLVLMSHLGRPKGKVNLQESLKPAAERLGELLGKPVQLGPPEVVGEATGKLVAGMAAGEVLLLENVRFRAEEEDKDTEGAASKGFSEALAGLGEVYVNDAFGTCHRKHASMYGAARAMQAKGGPAVAGLLVEKEIKYLDEALTDPRRPFVAILGGVKVSDKIKLISALLEKVDRILIGGAMAYTLLKARGAAVGKSLVEKDQVDAMKPLLEQAGEKILLPCDHVVTDAFESGEPTAVGDVDIPENLLGMDVGPRTVQAFCAAIASARTIVWNGPMGVFERSDYAAGTNAIAEAIARATDGGAVSVIGGGDSVAAVEQAGLEERMTHVSTGGGASLEYLEGRPMPPIEILDEK